MKTEVLDRDVIAIRQVVADSERLQKDLEGMVQLLTPDAVVINIMGRRVRGRSEIYQVLRAALSTPLADVIIRNEVQDIRFLRPDVAVVGCVKHIFDQRDPASRQAYGTLPPQGVLTLVLVKEFDSWLISTAQTTDVRTW